MTGLIDTPDRTTLLINQNNNFMRYAHINLICTKITFITLNNIKLSKRFRLICAASHVT